MEPEIRIKNAYENNLKNVSLSIPNYKLIVVTGVSGSGKTSLIHDVICVEGNRLFFENFIDGRYYNTKLIRPKVDDITGLFPVISINQNNVIRNTRSTVGTLTEIYDLLRLLYARLGVSENNDIKISRRLFSFNFDEGYCPFCKGLGVQDFIDPSLLIGDESKTIREGAFVLTTPNNYIVYSQVTMDVLDQLCRAEGFNVDIPWRNLSKDQKEVILYGSWKIKVLFGKHPLESRLKWSGITAKPREEDYYKGIVPVMEEILHRERNPNILRFAKTHVCKACNGKRLNDTALSVKLWNKDISELAEMNIRQINDFFKENCCEGKLSSVYEPIRNDIIKRSNLLLKLGAGHLTLNRDSVSLNGGEAQRIRIANQVLGGLRNILYVFDEPSVGLHPCELGQLLDVMRMLVKSGNTVILVDHDEQSIRNADWIIDIGPGAGISGGEVIFNGPAKSFFGQPQPTSITKQYLDKRVEFIDKIQKPQKEEFFNVEGANKNNLKNISASFLLNSFNVITGVSGSGKTSLIDYIIENSKELFVKNGSRLFKRLIYIDSSPIGRTPKSNPATYTGLSDYIRDLLASLPESKKRGYKKGQFSFVIKGGRCESCGGAGVQQIGMHFLGNVDVICEACEGRRFTEETLEIKYDGFNIYDILELRIDEAHKFFSGHKKITSITSILIDLGLGYLKLGQPSTTLSGGEAQRIKLATELAKAAGGQNLYIMDEPTTGLHMADVEILVNALKKLVTAGNTIICIEHDPGFILESDWLVDLGPRSADDGGSIVVQGYLRDIINNPESLTARNLKEYTSYPKQLFTDDDISGVENTIMAPIVLKGVETNNLKNIDVEFPINSITTVTGVSGSGKSSLVYGTLYAESHQRFFERLSFYSKTQFKKLGVPEIKESFGLLPAISLKKKIPVKNPRSIIATYTGLYDLYRLLFSRVAKSEMQEFRHLSTSFSFNSDEGACPQCKGLGSILVCDEYKLITNPEKPIIKGAMDGSKAGRFYGDPFGQYIATLQSIANVYKIDYSIPYNKLNNEAKEIALNGCGDIVFDVEWNYKRGSHVGQHKMKKTWPGFLKLVEDEYFRKHNDDRGELMLTLFKNETCNLCNGFRLKQDILDFRIGGLNIGQINAFSADDAIQWFKNDCNVNFDNELEAKAASVIKTSILDSLLSLQKAGLGYISTNRLVSTLSGGEFQRLQLAGLTKSQLNGVAYILDEPSFGLHPNDIKNISGLILNLNKAGNTVVMVEHSPVLIADSNITIELGPGAGNNGGEIIFNGDSKEYLKQLSGNELKKKERKYDGEKLRIIRANANNLKNIDIEIPIGLLTVITGVSGSGKTSLMDRVIYKSFRSGKPEFCIDISGFEYIEDLIYIEQTVTGTTKRNTIVGEELGFCEIIAKMFAQADESKKRGFKYMNFLKGSRDSRCDACEGTGGDLISMDFYNDVIIPCEHCDGTGFRDDVLNIRIQDKNIVDVLQLSFSALSDFFDQNYHDKSQTLIKNTFGYIEKSGLSYLSCKRLLKELSIGELQRLKLVTGLLKKKYHNTLFLFDEPTGGLNSKDIEKVINLFYDLLDTGSTIICVTHEPLILKYASKLIELGPGGGKYGGSVISNN